MENENKWEYDYSASNNETGYPNVGSSGMNTANQYNEPEVQPARPADTAPADGGSVPPTPPEQPQYSAPAQPEKPRRKKKFNGKKLARSAVALVLAAAMGFAGGFVGAKFGGSGKVVIQQVAPSSTASSSDSADSGIAAASSTGTGLTTEQVADMVSPSVVVITTEQVVYSQWSWYGQNQVESGAGSGVIISSDGYILTCDHVVSGASNITVTIGDKDYTATVVGEDSTSDIAVIKVEGTNFQPVVIGKSGSVQIGETVAAVGNPLGELTFSMSQGIVSCVNRAINVDGKPFNMIQVDCSINPGNSGGPLFNSYGEVIGIVSAKYSSYSNTTVEGIGFAIPIDDVLAMVKDIMTDGYVTNKPYIGITPQNMTAQMAQQYRYDVTQGVFVCSVEPGSAAEKAGLQMGDVITKIGDTAISDMNDLNAAKKSYRAGDTVTLTIYRAGGTKEVELTFDAVPQTQETAQDNSQQQQGGNNGGNGGYYYNPWDFFNNFFGYNG